MSEKEGPARDRAEEEVASEEAVAERDLEKPVKRDIDDQVDHEEIREHPTRQS